MTGQLPDVSYQGLNRQRVFADRGLAVDLTPFIKAEKGWAGMGYDQALLSLGQVKGQQVGIGFALSTPVIYYNADLMRKAGVEPDRFPTTWEAIMNAAKKSKSATPARTACTSSGTSPATGCGRRWSSATAAPC